MPCKKFKRLNKVELQKNQLTIHIKTQQGRKALPVHSMHEGRVTCTIFHEICITEHVNQCKTHLQTGKTKS